MANEPNYCGFLDQKSACSYCQQYSSDACCQMVNGCQSLSGGAIAGIVLGILIFLGICFALFWYFKRQKNGRFSQNNPFNGFLMKNNNRHSRRADHGSGALGYKSLVSQKALYEHDQRSDDDMQLMNHTTPLQFPPLPPLPTTTTTTNNNNNNNSNTATTTIDHQQQPLLLPNTSQPMEEFYEVKHPYPPQMGDELGLHVGDIVCVAMNFDDGWALGFNVTTGLKGVFPVVCVTRAPEELIEQLLSPSEPTTKTELEDGFIDHMQLVCENATRSATSRPPPSSPLTQHDSIPKRTASIMRSGAYGYSEGDSPTSPTLNTPFFDINVVGHDSHNNNRLSQPEPALLAETYEMHNNPNRVSKLEQ